MAHAKPTADQRLATMATVDGLQMAVPFNETRTDQIVNWARNVLDENDRIKLVLRIIYSGGISLARTIRSRMNKVVPVMRDSDAGAAKLAKPVANNRFMCPVCYESFGMVSFPRLTDRLAATLLTIRFCRCSTLAAS